MGVIAQCYIRRHFVLFHGYCSNILVLTPKVSEVPVGVHGGASSGWDELLRGSRTTGSQVEQETRRYIRLVYESNSTAVNDHLILGFLSRDYTIHINTIETYVITFKF